MNDSDTYPPIADYGLISDMHSCALVSRTGSIDWCCFPRFDSPSVFRRIPALGKGGYFTVPAAGLRPGSRRSRPERDVDDGCIPRRRASGR